MSFLTALGKGVKTVANDVTVEVKSALEEALKSIPDKEMTPEEITQAVTNRSVQKLEMEQSGFNGMLRDYQGPDTVLPKVKPSTMLNRLSTWRQDKYTTVEITGTPHYPTPPRRAPENPQTFMPPDLAHMLEEDRLVAPTEQDISLDVEFDDIFAELIQGTNITTPPPFANELERANYLREFLTNRNSQVLYQDAVFTTDWTRNLEDRISQFQLLAGNAGDAQRNQDAFDQVLGNYSLTNDYNLEPQDYEVVTDMMRNDNVIGEDIADFRADVSRLLPENHPLRMFVMHETQYNEFRTLVDADDISAEITLNNIDEVAAHAENMRDAIAGGYNRPDELNEEDLNSLIDEINTLRAVHVNHLRYTNPGQAESQRFFNEIYEAEFGERPLFFTTRSIDGLLNSPGMQGDPARERILGIREAIVNDRLLYGQDAIPLEYLDQMPVEQVQAAVPQQGVTNEDQLLQEFRAMADSVGDESESLTLDRLPEYISNVEYTNGQNGWQDTEFLQSLYALNARRFDHTATMNEYNAIRTDITNDADDLQGEDLALDLTFLREGLTEHGIIDDDEEVDLLVARIDALMPAAQAFSQVHNSINAQFNGLLDELYGANRPRNPELSLTGLNDIRWDVQQGGVIVDEEQAIDALDRLTEIEQRLISTYYQPPQQETTVRPIQTTTESMDLDIPVRDMVAEAQDALDEIADDIGIVSRIDANDPTAVERFLTNVDFSNLNDHPRSLLHSLNQAYPRLAQAIRNGDQSVTIPNFNTREVQPTRYTFSDQAYRSYTLPDTNDATYRVTIYNNPAVDKKGRPYDGVSHFQSTRGIEDGVFHVRADSPINRPEVTRIQELQSDIQNTMSKAKKHAKKEWAKGGENRFTVDDVMYGMFDGTMTPAIANARRAVNEHMAIAIKEDTGLELNALNIGRTDLGELSFGELRTALAESINLAFVDNMHGSTRQLVRDIRQGNYMSHADIPDQVLADIQKVQPAWGKTEIANLIAVSNRMRDEYANFVDGLAHEVEKNYPSLRVTPEQRMDRIKYLRGSASEEELKLGEESLKAGVKEAASELGVELHRPITYSDEGVEDAVFRNIFGEGYMVILKGMRTRTSPYYNKNYDPYVDYNSTRMQELLQESFGDEIPNVMRIVDLAKQKRDKYIRANMDKLTPLEQFPDQDKYSLDVPYIKQGFQEEAVRAINEGKKELWLAVEPRGYDKLIRGDGPHSSYVNGTHNKQFRAIAKRLKADIVEEDGYLKMVFPTAAKLAAAGGAAAVLSLPAYAEPANQDFRVQAFKEGFRPGEVDTYLKETPIPEEEDALWYAQARNEGFSEEELTQYRYEQWVNELSTEQLAKPTTGGIANDIPRINEQGQSVFETTYSSLPDADVKALAIELKQNPTTPTGIDAIYKEHMRRNNPTEYNKAYGKTHAEIENDIADLIELNDVDRPFLWAGSKMGFANASATYETLRARDRNSVIELGKEQGYEIVYGDGIPVAQGGNGGEVDHPYVRNGQGELVSAEPNFMAVMARYFGEGTGGVVGAAKGVQAAGKLGTVIDPLLAGAGAPGRVLSALAKFGTITAYTAAGAILGDQVDYASAAIRQEADMNWAMAAEKAMGSAEVTLVAEALAIPVAVVGKFVWNKAMNAYREVRDGNLDAAYEILKDITGLDDDQIAGIVERWKLLNTPDAVGQPLTIAQKSAVPFSGGVKQRVLNPKEEALAIVPTTSAGGDALVQAAGAVDARASIVTARRVDRRAKDLLLEAKARMTGALAEEDLVLSSRKALDEYIHAEQAFYEQTRVMGNDIVATASPNYKAPLETTVLKPLLDSIAGSVKKKGAAEQAAHTVGQILENLKSGTFDDLIEMRQLMNQLSSTNKNMKHKDAEAFRETMATIDSEIDRVMGTVPGGREWLKQWEEAKAGYSKMKKLTTNRLAKAMRRDGTNPEELAKAIIKYGKASDGTYSDLMRELDPKLWSKVETSIVDALVNRHAFGMEGGFRAIQFPELDKVIGQYDFLTKDASEMQQAVARLAEVYTNDVSLSYISGGIKLSSPQQALTTNLMAKAKYSTASMLWNHIHRYLGTSGANMASTVRKVADFLDNPLDAATVKEAVQVAKNDAELLKAIDEVQKQAALAAAKQTGTMRVKTFKNKEGHTRYEPADGYTWNKETIPMHQITSEQVLVEKLRMDPAHLSEVDKRLLKSRGFKAIGLKDGTLLILE